MVSSITKVNLESLSWESDFFSLKTAKLQLTANDVNGHYLDDDSTLLQTLSTLEFGYYDRVQCKIPMDRVEWLDALTQNGFELVEGEIDLVYDLEAIQTQNRTNPHDDWSTLSPSPILIDNHLISIQAGLEHIDLLKHHASKLFRNSRFRPKWYKPGDSAAFYATWIEKAVLGTFDTTCLLIKDALYTGDLENEAILGFVSLRQLSATEARIGLLGSFSLSHGNTKRYIGTALVEMAKAWAKCKGLSKLYVATQSSNIPALRLYIKTGANITATSYWLYK